MRPPRRKGSVASRSGWRKEGNGLDARYYHDESGWVIIHCGHPTANWPYYGQSPHHQELFLYGGFGRGYAFQYLADAQEKIELYLENNKQERTKAMGIKSRKKAVASRKEGDTLYDDDGNYLAGTPAGKKVGKRRMTAAEKDRAARQRKHGGKYLDKKTHKLVAGHKSACGKPMGEMSAGVWSGGVEGRDSWHFVDCKGCLALMPKVIHSVRLTTDYFGVMHRFDDTDGSRWKLQTVCGKKKSPLETTSDNTAGGVNCLDCLTVVAPVYRHHFQGRGLGQTSTLCGAKNKATNQTPTDSWWLVTCPDCYRVRDAPTIHPSQEEDILLLFHNSMVAARNQGHKPSQEKCGLCFEKAPVKTRCLGCAVIERRGGKVVNGVEDELVRILGLPYEWVMDLLKGWDSDKQPEVTYPSALKLGKRLWRKHG